MTRFFQPKSVVAALLMAASTLSIATPVYAIDDGDKAEIEKIIHEYLINNPDILVEMQMAMEKKQQEEVANKQKETLQGMKEQIFNSKYQLAVGNPDAKLTIVEFFDYNCGFCRKAMEDMDKIIANNKDVRFVVKEFPVLGPESMAAHKVSLAVQNVLPEKYGEFHRMLLEKNGQKNGDVAKELAIELGADKDKLEAAIANPELDEAIQEAYQLANGLGINGTPSYVIGDTVEFGAVGYDKLQEFIDEAKKAE